MYHRLTLVVAFGLVLCGVMAWHLLEQQRALAMAAAEQARASELAAQLKAAPARADESPRPALVHTVIFYLKKDAAGEQDKMIADSHKLLATIPTVKHLWVGKPSEKGTPKVAVTDYHLALSILFADADGLHQYLDHPQHKEFVAKHEPQIEKVLVYDFTNEPAK